MPTAVKEVHFSDITEAICFRCGTVIETVHVYWPGSAYHDTVLCAYCCRIVVHCFGRVHGPILIYNHYE